MDNLTGLTAATTGATAKEDVTLAVNGKLYMGWKTISVKRSIKAIAGGFDLGVMDKWAQEQTPWRIVQGDECELRVGSDTLITGYVDAVAPSFDATQRAISVRGRDKAGDMVDCSAEHRPGVWSNITLGKLANILAKPFGIGVTELVVVPDVFSWKLQQGESAFESLERAARLRGVLLANDGAGNIVITRAGTARASTELVQGVNILSASADYEYNGRFSKYVVKSQTQSVGDEETAPEVDFSVKGEATDPEVKRYRPIIIVSEGAASPAVCITRAKWESSVRAGRSSKLQVTVQGWRQANGKLWQMNELAMVRSPHLGVAQDFLIVGTTISKSDKGTTTLLDLESPLAYVPDPTLIVRKEPWDQLVKEERKR